ncbi:copper amine oxidase N-terminal domain-containing protein [Brevibacillus brevis]|uniref:stalk domain-containing protein n=1 Tax=Brevibacillus brevis TaxID=1393 RepID=UPI001F29C8A7|nr:stalk domain-containing protein [Brevibacillus brevis]UIO43720.1 copper amine oxidase N-terminal domain-containing protein [Brevibacillus brevis]
MFKKQYLAIASALILTTTLIPTSSQAATGTKNLQAKYNNIKVIYNGAAVPTTIEPFIVNGTTYIPLRMMAGVFSKDVAWDGAKYTITVKDLPNSQHANELAARDAQIRSLQNTIDSLNKEISDLKNNKKNNNNKKSDDIQDALDDLEDDLNSEYDDYEKLEWDISLSGDEDDIDVEIAIDLDDYQDEFDDLSKSDLENLVEKIIKDIWDDKDFEDADIKGEIVDSSDNDEELYDFDGDAKSGDITFDGDEIN